MSFPYRFPFRFARLIRGIIRFRRIKPTLSFFRLSDPFVMSDIEDAFMARSIANTMEFKDSRDIFSTRAMVDKTGFTDITDSITFKEVV